MKTKITTILLLLFSFTLPVFATDTDGDGVADAVEIADGTSPNNDADWKPFSRDMLLCYPFEGNANDISGNGGNATLYNGPGFVLGVHGQAVAFDGEDDYFARTPVPINGNPFTYSIWVKLTTNQPLGTWMTVFQQGQGWQYSPILQARAQDASHFELGGYTYASGYRGISSSPVLCSDPYGWHHIVWTSTPTGDRKLYLDGVVVASTTGQAFGEQHPYLRLGGNMGENQYDPYLADEFRVYNRALSDTEVAAMFANQAPVLISISGFNPSSGPVGTSVTITGANFTGANFTGATGVRFGGVDSTSFTVDSDTQITATVPTGALAAPITVVTPDGSASSSESFSVTEVAQIISFPPIPTKEVGCVPFSLTATASSCLPVTYSSSNQMVATIEGDTLIVRGVGATVITSSQGGNSTYSAAVDVKRVFRVTRIPGLVGVWGYNHFGQCEVPIGLKNIVDVSAGFEHTVAVKCDGTVVAWGGNAFGEGTIPPGLTGVVAIAAGYQHTVALKENGKLVAWGDNREGATAIPEGLTDVVSVAAGQNFTVALKSNGTVLAWGSNNYGGEATVPVGLTGVVSIAAGHTYTVALKCDGTVASWGNTGCPTVPENLNGVIAVSAFGDNAIALKSDGSLITWGSNGYGEMNVPAGLSNVRALAAGYHHTMVLTGSGTVTAWGDSGSGQTSVPTALSGVSGISSGYFHSAAIVSMNQPGISSISPSNGSFGATVTITGTNLHHVTAVRFGGVDSVFNAVSETELVVTVPPGAQSGPITVISAGIVVSSESFTLDWSYESNGDYITITKYNGPGGNVQVPTTIGGLPVKSVGSFWGSGNWETEGAFRNRYDISSVTLPPGLLTIGQQAFSGCSGLTDIVLPETVTEIGSSAFQGCFGLKVLRIPDSVTNVAQMVFAGCTGLEKVIVGSGVQLLGDGVFSGCTGMRELVLFEGLRFLGADAFEGCSSLRHVVIPASLQEIRNGPFMNCSGLRSVLFLGNFPNVQSGIFYNSSNLEAVYFVGNGPQWVSDSYFYQSTPTLYRLPIATGWPEVPQTSCGRPTAYWYRQAPAVTSFAPDFGGAGCQVTITGSGLLETTAVRFGKISAVFQIETDSRITAVVPAGFSGGLVTVVNAVGSGSSSASFLGSGSTLQVTIASATGVPFSGNSVEPEGFGLDASLSFHPATGTHLTIIDNTGPAPIRGRFINLSQGQRVDLSYQGTTYHFVANYHGGTGNDLVLQWADNYMLGWKNAGTLAGKTILAVDTGIALCSDGTIVTWVNNQPVIFEKTGALVGKEVVNVVSGGNFFLALCSDGSVASWGANSYQTVFGTGYGQLGNGSTADSSVPVAVDHQGVLVGKQVVAISAGGGRVLVICSDGNLYAWGNNCYGQLGDGTATDRVSPVAVSMGILQGKSIISIKCGDVTSYALCADGTLAAWGDGTSGELCSQPTNWMTGSTIPVNLTNEGLFATRRITSIAPGRYHCVALCSDETLAAWGNNYYGELGAAYPGPYASYLPVMVERTGALVNQTVMQIGPNPDGGLALCADRSLVVWGGGGGPSAIPTAGMLPGECFMSGSNGLVMTHLVAMPIAGNVDVRLSSLTTSTGSFNPTFSSDVTDYTASVSNDTASITVTPTTTNPLATVTVNGMIAASGAASQPVLLSVGDNAITVQVTSQGSIATRIYSLVVTRGAAFNFIDDFEAATIHAFWTQRNQNTTTTLQSGVVHAGAQAVQFTTTTGGQKEAQLEHGFDQKCYGTASVWVRDLMEHIYFSLVLRDTDSGEAWGIGVQDWDYSAYYSVGGKTSFARSTGWHHFTIEMGETAIRALIDGQVVYAGAGGLRFNKVVLSMSGPGDGSVYFDDFAFQTNLTPSISGFSPASGQVGTIVNISGSNFTGASAVKFGGVVASSFTVVSPNQITTTVPTGAQTGPITVLTPVGTVTSATDFVVTTTFANWRSGKFTATELSNPAISGDLATPAHDGISNLMKYALALEPMVCGAGDLPYPEAQGEYLTLTFRQNKQAGDITFIVEAGDSLTGGEWLPATTELSRTDEGDHWLVTVRDNTPIAISARRFMRIKVSR